MGNSIQTTGYPNGYWLSKKSINSIAAANMYITGCADGILSEGDHKRFKGVDSNENIVKNELVSIVRLYYKENPLNKSKSIVAVVRQVLSDGTLNHGLFSK